MCNVILKSLFELTQIRTNQTVPKEYSKPTEEYKIPVEIEQDETQQEETDPEISNDEDEKVSYKYLLLL